MNRILVILLILFFSSCSIFQKQPVKREEVIIYPAPPDKPRFQYLTSISTSNDIKGKRSPFATFIFGEEKAFGINRPNGIHTSEGKIFVCDVPIKGLEVIDLENKAFTFFIPKGKGELRTPISCCTDTSGYLYVADIGRKEVIIYNVKDDYKFVSSIKEEGIYNPNGITITDNKLYVANTPGHKIHVYDKGSDKLLFTFPDAEKEDPEYLFSPNHISSSDKYIYVTDFGDFKIKIYDLEGNYIRSVGSYGKQFGQFGRPKGVAADKEDFMYVVDASFENVQIFNDKGQVLMFFGGPYKSHGDMYLPKGITIDYHNVKYFKDYIDPLYTIKYLVLVTNQHGPDKINVYGAIKY